MNKSWSIISLGVFIFLVACAKDEMESDATGAAIKTISGADNCNARNIFQDAQDNLYVASVGNEDETSASAYGLLTPWLHKYDGMNGNLLWQKQLPSSVHNLVQVLPLRNGNILCAGLDSTRESETVGLVLLNQDGELIRTHTFFNQFFSLQSNRSLSCVELLNGDIALLIGNEYSFSLNQALRLCHFSADLDLLKEDVFTEQRLQSNPAISLGEDGALRFLSRERIASRNQINMNTVEIETFNLNSKEVFYDGTYFVVNSNLLSTSNGRFMWSACEGITEFNLRNQETFKANDSISVFTYNSHDDTYLENVVTGFTQEGFLSKIIESGTGFIGIGTSNIRLDSFGLANYSILLVKFDDDLNVEWVKELNGQFTSLVGADIIDVGSGYQISATHYSISDYNKPVMLRVDYQGNIF